MDFLADIIVTAVDLIYLVTTFTLLAIVSLLGGGSVGGSSACETSLWSDPVLRHRRDFTFICAALTQASVDGILESLAALEDPGHHAFTGVTVDPSGGASAIPGPAGLTAKATLGGRGCTVTTKSIPRAKDEDALRGDANYYTVTLP